MEQTLDDALRQLRGYGYVLRNGLTNHAPMVAETLQHLGLEDHIQAWLEPELARCVPRPAPSHPIIDKTWKTTLGDPNRFSDWALLIEQQIQQHGWRTTAGVWVVRLSPGFASAAAHGVIRTGHAARALAAADTPERRLELADALAAWACTYAELPTAAHPPKHLSVAQALMALAPEPNSGLAERKSITEAMAALHTDVEFAQHFHALDLNDDPMELMLDVAATFARLFCQSVTTPLQAIVFTHAITAVAAVYRLAPYLEWVQLKSLLQHAFHTGCALHRIYSTQPYHPTMEDPLTPGAEECLYDALHHGDEHVLKLTDACLEFSDITGDGFFLTAAERCRRLLPRRNAAA